MRSTLLILTIICCLFSLGCQQAEIPGTSVLTKEDLRQIDDILESLSDVDNIISFSISENDEIIKTFYYEDVPDDYKNNVVFRDKKHHLPIGRYRHGGRILFRR